MAEDKKIDFKKIWTFIKGKIFIAIVIAGLVGFNAMQCSRIQDLKRQQSISEQNIIALNDSLKYERTNSGELIVSIAGYIASEKELKTLNKNLWERVKAQDGKIITLNRAIVQLIQDTTELRKYLVEKDKLIEKLLKVDENTYVAPWSLTYKYDSTNFDIFTGKTYIGVINKDPLELKHIDTELTKRLTQIDFTWGQKIEKDQLRIYIQSNYPGFTVAQMEGVLIDPNTIPYVKDLMKKRHWFTGFGVGPTFNLGYDFLHNQPAAIIGVGIHYNVYEW